jgi:hypothetical protein
MQGLPGEFKQHGGLRAWVAAREESVERQHEYRGGTIELAVCMTEKSKPGFPAGPETWFPVGPETWFLVLKPGFWSRSQTWFPRRSPERSGGEEKKPGLEYQCEA